MTIDQIKDSIKFKVEPDSVSHHTKVMATITVFSVVMVSTYETSPRFDMMDMVQRNLRETIIRQLFEDQRREMAEAIQELYRISPMDFIGWRTAVDKIMEKARYTKPEFQLDHKCD